MKDNNIDKSEVSQLVDEFVEHPYIANRVNNYLPQKLIVSQIDFSKIELKIYEMFVNQINYSNIISTSGLMVKIPIGYIKQYMTIEQIKDATSKMSEKKMTMYDVNHPEIEFRHLPVFSEISYNHKQSGFLVFKSNPAISEYLILGSNYAKYPLETTLNFKHSYSILLYRLLISHNGQNRKQFIYSIDEIRKLLNVPNDIYRDLYMFKERVLNPAIAEIAKAKKNPIDCTYENCGNRQRYVTHLKFTIKSVLDSIESEKSDFTQAVNVNPKLVFQHVHEILIKNYNLKDKIRSEILSRNDLIDKFVTLHIEFENGLYPKVKNRTAYILACLGLVKKKTKT